MNNNLVSIITPMYNAEKFVEDTINSVLNQTYKSWEMIIVDDCSSDNSAEIVKSYVQRDKRIKYIKTDLNKGVSNARNIAIKKARGRYIAFLDSDDIWYENKLEKQVSFIKANNYTIVYSAYELIDENNNKLNKIINVSESVDYNNLLKGNILGCLTVMIDKTKVNFEIKMSGKRHEDYILWLSILKSGNSAYGINEILAQYRKSSKSLSGNKAKSAKWTWDIYREVEKLPLHKSIYYFWNYALGGIKKK
ncbi:MAG: glycosyltransferase family 2 protein [Romboutsia sp.]